MWWGCSDTLDAQYHINNINGHIYVMIWSRSYYSITLLSSMQRPSSRFVKITPKSHVLVGNRNICDRVVAIRWTHNITSITSTPIYMWWFDHVHITLSCFSAPCNVRHSNLPRQSIWSLMAEWIGGKGVFNFLSIVPNAFVYVPKVMCKPVMGYGW